MENLNILLIMLENRWKWRHSKGNSISQRK